jgi:CBS domain-containing protein
MSSHVVSLSADATVHEALEQFVENRVSALPIVDNNERCIGIITATDLVEITYDIDDDLTHTDTLNASSRRRLVDKLIGTVGNEPVTSYASEKVASIAGSSSLQAAARLMLREQVHHLPVVNEQEQLIGILSTMDVVAAVADQE